ncbi:hypothetical protein M758_UG125300 [Ceratodon purpureus]|nr:hypothetical protein M758_UG125300 [Ceratodon purpureus]
MAFEVTAVVCCLGVISKVVVVYYGCRCVHEAAVNQSACVLWFACAGYSPAGSRCVLACPSVYSMCQGCDAAMTLSLRDCEVAVTVRLWDC